MCISNSVDQYAPCVDVVENSVEMDVSACIVSGRIECVDLVENPVPMDVSGCIVSRRVVNEPINESLGRSNEVVISSSMLETQNVVEVDTPNQSFGDTSESGSDTSLYGSSNSGNSQRLSVR